jgi:hypothetical protein
LRRFRGGSIPIKALSGICRRFRVRQPALLQFVICWTEFLLVSQSRYPFPCRPPTCGGQRAHLPGRTIVANTRAGCRCVAGEPEEQRSAAIPGARNQKVSERGRGRTVRRARFSCVVCAASHVCHGNPFTAEIHRIHKVVIDRYALTTIYASTSWGMEFPITARKG